MKRSLSLAAGLLLAGTSLAGTAWAQSDTIVVARSVDADNLDPQKTSNTQSLQVTGLIYDTLLTLDDQGGLHPGLASEWSVSDDGLTYSFTMRDGIKCHDGSTLDAAATAASITRAVDPATNNPNSSAWGPIASATGEGNVVTVKLSQPYGPFLSFLTSILGPIVCPSSFAGSEFTPIGTGPYAFVDWVRNDKIDLKANPDYHNSSPLIENPGAPYIQNLVLKVIPEGVARMAALKSGEVQFAEPSLEEAALLQDDPAYKVYAAQLSGQQILMAFTWRIPPLDNVNVRRAIAAVVERGLYAEIAFEGLVEPAYCPVAPRLLGSDEAQCESWGVPEDLELAKKLLAEAGYGPDHPLDIVLSTHKLPGWDRMHEIMLQELASVGINAKLEQREVAAFFDHMSGENQRTDGPPVVWTMGMSGVDPDYLYFLWHTPGFVNMGLNADLDKMLEDQRALTGDARTAKILEIHKYLLENVYAVPLLSPGWGWLMASSANLEGFKMGHIASLLFNDVKYTQ